MPDIDEFDFFQTLPTEVSNQPFNSTTNSMKRKRHDPFQALTENPLRTKLGSDHQGDIGIEIELEVNPQCDFPQSPVHWLLIGEDSLRHGFEIITKGNLRIGTSRYNNTLASLSEFLGKHKDILQTSIRTSTHLHFSVLDYTIHEIYNICLHYYLIENLLVATNDKCRHGNLFCRRLQDANGIIKHMKESIANGSIQYFVNQYKYGALNLASISNLGSVEFRFMEASTDPSLTKLNLDIQILHSLVTKCRRFNIHNSIKLIEDHGIKPFLSSFLTQEQVEYLTNLDIETLNEFSTCNLADVESLGQSLDNLGIKLKKRHCQPQIAVQRDSDEVHSHFLPEDYDGEFYTDLKEA